MFKYSQIDSNFSIELVRECRGLILDEDTREIVSFPFTKFFNFGEPNAANVDWATARCGEKIDGSLVKIVNVGDNLLISTNGTILACEAPVAKQIGCRYQSFGDIVADVLDDVLEKSGWQKKLQEEGLCALWEESYTYMFELCSPWTRVVVPHKENKLYFLGKRNNQTFEETYFTDDPVFSKLFSVPKVYPLKSFDECIAATKDMPWDEEGYVVCDANFNRIKIKSPAYLVVHRLKGNGVMSYERALDLIRLNETDEILAYFPEFKEHIETIKAKYDAMLDDLASLERRMKDWMEEAGIADKPWLVKSGGKMRKDLAAWAFKNTKLTGVVFALADHKVESAKAWLEASPTKNLCKILGLKEDER